MCVILPVNFSFFMIFMIVLCLYLIVESREMTGSKCERDGEW